MRHKIFKYLSLLFFLFLISSGLSKNYKGAELRTNESFIYGRFEVRYKAPAGDGFLASFFTYHDFTSGIQDWNEIDLEIMGRYSDNIQFNTITPGQTNHESHQYVPFNPHLDFYTYGFEWTPDYVAWFVDGEELYRQTGEHIQTLQLAQKLMMNIWIPEYENWAGVWNPQLLPKFACYDWVSYASYTPGTGDTGTDQNFSLQWKDDFDSWNTDRWSKASHTWQGNSTDFVHENVVFQNGEMILCLTDDVDLGLVDNIPPYILWARAKQTKIKLRFSEAVDTASALKTSSYFINNLSVEKVMLSPDQQSVELEVSPVDSEQVYSLAVLGVKDQSANQNTQMGQVVPIIIARPLSFPVKINVGGGTVYGEFLEDQSWGPEKEYGHMDGHSNEWNTVTDITGTEQDSLYFSELSGAVKYKVRVPKGIYSVKLHFSENEVDENDKRIFKIVVEDSLVTDKIDLVLVAGMHCAYDVQIQNIQVDDGILDIHLVDWVGRSILNGLTIQQLSTDLGVRGQAVPKSIELYQNYPNPFNPSTKIRYRLSQAEELKIEIFDLAGRKVQTLIHQKQSPGNHSLSFNANGISSGIYFYRLTSTTGFRQNRKMIFLK